MDRLAWRAMVPRVKETRQGTVKKESRQVEKRKSEMVLPSRGYHGRKNRSSEIAPV